MTHTHDPVDMYPTDAGFPALEQIDDRAAAGRQLAALLRPYQEASGIVLALTPGGVAVAGEVARALRLSIDVLVARTFVVPPYTVDAGAVCEGAGLCLNGVVWRPSDIPCDDFWDAARAARREVLALARLYRQGRTLLQCRRRVVMLVDDGLGSGLRQLAALQVLRRSHPRRCIVATPCAAPTAVQRVALWADIVIAPTCCRDDQADAPRWKSCVSDPAAAALLEQYRQATLH